MSSNKEKETPIIIIKKKGKGGHGGGHGGSWKVAFADFATAMMAFFLVLWLMANTTPVEKKAIAAYFSKPDSFQAISSHASPNIIDSGATNSLSSGASNSIQDQNLTHDNTDQLASLKSKVEQEIQDGQSFASYNNNVMVDMTPEGLRIQILDNLQRPMFENGSADLIDYADEVLTKIAPSLNAMGSRISIEGFTDAAPFSSRRFFSNWELSTERANAARRALLRGGLSENLIAEVVGRASNVLYDKSDPLAASNRRISIMVLNNQAVQILNKHDQVSNTVPISDAKPATIPGLSPLPIAPMKPIESPITDLPLPVKDAPAKP